MSHWALTAEAMVPHKTTEDQWMSNSVARRATHDDQWREYRRNKAMSWPKSFLSSDMTLQVDCQGSSRMNVVGNAEQQAEVEGPLLNKQSFLGRSIGRLLEETKEASELEESSITSRMKRLNEATSHNKINYKRWSVDNELSIQPNSKENNSTEKHVGYRRAKGGLRDLIRLHEEEIARAAGAPKAFAKRPKHDESRTLSNPCSFDDYLVEPIHDTIPPDIDKGRDVLVEKQRQAKHSVAESVVIDINSNEYLATERGLYRQQRIEFSDKSTSMDENDTSLPTEIELELSKQVSEKDQLINTLLQEKEDLLCKLEEQKKVANAYQKLEDRYRRKVFELEKVLLSCSCGVLESKSTSEQDLTKHFANR